MLVTLVLVVSLGCALVMGLLILLISFMASLSEVHKKHLVKSLAHLNVFKSFHLPKMTQPKILIFLLVLIRSLVTPLTPVTCIINNFFVDLIQLLLKLRLIFK